MRPGAAVLAVAAASALALASPPARGDERVGGPADAAERPCGTRAEGGRPIVLKQTGDDVRVGPLLLAGVRRRPASPSFGAEWPFVAKVPVLLRARSRVVLAIPPDASDVAALQHANGWVRSVRFRACFERVRAWTYTGTVGETTFFPFAVGLRRRVACLPIELWIDGRGEPARRMVPIGRRSC